MLAELPGSVSLPRPPHRCIAAIAILAAPLAAAAVLKGPYVLLEDAVTLSLRLEVDRPEVTVVVQRAGGAADEVRLTPDFIRTPRDTFVARATIDLRSGGRFRGYEIWHDGRQFGRYEWRSRIDGTLTADPRLLIFGDTQGGKQITARLAARWQAEDFDLLVGLGDLVDAGSRYESWEEEFFGPLKGVLPHHPMLVVAGNHDPYRERSMAWFDAFLGRADACRYYAIDFGDLRLIGLNNSDAHTKYGIDPVDPLTPQHAFLARALLSREAQSRRAVIFAHVPLFSASTVVNREFGSELQRRYVLPLLERARVLGFFAGHHHKYERLLRRGLCGETQYVVTGGGGGHLFAASRETGGTKMDRQIFEVHHYLVVDFRDRGTLVARSIEGAELDRASFGVAAGERPGGSFRLHRSTLNADFSISRGEPVHEGIRLRPDDGAGASRDPSTSAELYRTSAGLVAVARDLPGPVTWQGYDAGRRAWGYLQGAILTPPADDVRRALTVVAINGADLTPFDRVFPVTHWPVAGSRAGVTEKSGAVLLLRGLDSFDFAPSLSRTIGRWRWGPGADVAPAIPQMARQLAALEGAAEPRTLEGAVAPALLAQLRASPREVFVVSTGSDAVVTVLVHWPRWRFLAVVPGASLTAGTEAILLRVEADTEIAVASDRSGTSLRIGSGRPTDFLVPLAHSLP